MPHERKIHIIKSIADFYEEKKEKKTKEKRNINNNNNNNQTLKLLSFRDFWSFLTTKRSKRWTIDVIMKNGLFCNLKRLSKIWFDFNCFLYPLPP